MTSLVAPARLPGVYFLPPRRITPEAIPPLDVAAFVGYAERGPLNLPVALEDARQYADVFGGDLPLARDEQGQPVYAYLPDAVKSFFANGGRRCYAVRVAGQAARSAVFSLPGLIALDQAETPRLALIEASSQGAWANLLRMATRIATLPLSAASFARQPESLLWTPGANINAIEPGDVLRIQDSAGRQFLVPVTDVPTAGRRHAPGRPVRTPRHPHRRSAGCARHYCRPRLTCQRQRPASPPPGRHRDLRRRGRDDSADNRPGRGDSA